MAPKQTKTETEKVAPIIIKKIKRGGAGHHGGAWKVAYADFVTAMMAFFLLLWLLNVTTEVQKNAISNYFDPSHPQVSSAESGAGGVMGGMSMSVDGAMVSSVQPITQPQVPQTTTRGALQGEELPSEIQDMDPDEITKMTQNQLEHALDRIDEKRFKEAEKQIREEIAKSPELKELQNNLLIDITPEGLRIQIVDDQGRSMFKSGSAMMEIFMQNLLGKVTGVVKGLPNQVSIRGHTDATQYRTGAAYDNWNLSSDRALASRRVLVSNGLPAPRIENVVGRADREPLLPKDPNNPRNRRISIIMLRERLTKPVTPQSAKDAVIKAKAEAAAKPAATATPATGQPAAQGNGSQPATGANNTAVGTGNAAAVNTGQANAGSGGTATDDAATRGAGSGRAGGTSPLQIVDDTPGRKITAPNWTKSSPATTPAQPKQAAPTPAPAAPVNEPGRVLEFE